jgi:hypothetical protein
MTRDLQEIKRGLAQAKAAIELLETMVGEYESRMVNVLPSEDVKFYRAEDDEIISGGGLGDLTSLNEALRRTAEQLAAEEVGS